MADKLQLRKRELDYSVGGIVNVETRVKYLVNAVTKSRTTQFNDTVTLVTLPSITGMLPSRQVKCTEIDIPTEITLADPEFNIPGPIDAILGNQLFFTLLCLGRIKLCAQNIIIQETLVGWIVTGATTKQEQVSKGKPSRSLHASSLDNALTKFWEIEEIAERKNLSSEEQACENQTFVTTNSRIACKICKGEHFVSSCPKLLEVTPRDRLGIIKKGKLLGTFAMYIRDVHGRYIVRLPFNDRKNFIGESRGLALKRFYSLERKFCKDPDLLIHDKQFLSEYLALGHMTEVSDARDGKDFYLPHHAVIKECSFTTKVRQLAEDKQIRFPNASRTFKEDFYVDDLLTGAFTFNEAINLRNELIELARNGGFHLHQWASNNHKLISDHDNRQAICLDLSQTKKTLGVFLESIQ
ncbi:uncharacterized protein LOC143260793 [Megalopta genalis]|uniref:uncharacterized protein LOC143260793 n=1 Tax=Megalopta genalis TaxID=115081 RepID=UPI003FD4CDAB